MATEAPKRKPGRPPGSGKPKAPKEPKKMGGPSKWPEALQPAGKIRHRLPLVFDQMIENPEFREKLTNLMLDIRYRK